MQPKKKIIGVLGGMGPESTAIFYQALIAECQQQYGAVNDEDYPEIFIYTPRRVVSGSMLPWGKPVLVPDGDSAKKLAPD